MKITVKTLQQKVFQVTPHLGLPPGITETHRCPQIDAEPSDTVGVLKSRIETEQGHAISGQKLIYSGEIGSSDGIWLRINPQPGKILPDDKTVESLNFKEKDFLVLMVAKVRGLI